MDLDVDDEGSVDGSENMEIRSDSRSSPTFCRCGAYDEIMEATKILRNRTIDAVNSEFDQFEKGLAYLLRSSRDALCHEDDGASTSSQMTFEESRNSPACSFQSQSHSSQLSSERSPSIDLIVNDIVVNASLLLLSKLKLIEHRCSHASSLSAQLMSVFLAIAVSSFRPEEWRIGYCFTENRCLPAEFIERYCPSDIWKHPRETAFKAASDSNKAESSFTQQSRSSFVSTGLLGRILNFLWPRDRLSLCVEQLLSNKRMKFSSINSVHVFDILDSDWVSLGPSSSTLAIPFIAGALACLDRVQRILTQLMRLVKALEGLSVWIDFTASKGSQLPFSLWNAVRELLTLLEQQIEQSAKEVTATAKAVPIASPEEPTNDDTVAGNWLECILEQVPAMLDHQSAVQSQIVSEIVEISKRIEFLLRLLANARDMSKCNNCISDVVEKVQNLSNNEIVGEFQSTYITLSQGGFIGADLQTKLLHEILSRGGQQKTLLLRTIISGGRSNRPQLVAEIFKHSLERYEQAVGSKISERLCREECTILEEFSHSLKKAHATDFARQTLGLIERIIADENSSVILVDGVTSLLLTLVHRNQECPWTLDLKMLGRIESEWSKIINSFAEFSLRHPSQSFLCGTYSLLISEHFLGAAESLDLPVLLFVIRHLPRLISDQGQRDVQNFNNHYPGMEAIIKQFVHPDSVSKLADRAVKLFAETLNDGCWQIYVQSFVLTVLVIESTGNRLGAALFESFTNLLHSIDVHEVKDACIGLEATGGIDRLHCMLSIFRNTTFCDLVPCFEEQCRQALKEDVLTKLIADNHRTPRKSDLATFLKGEDDCFGEPGNNVDEYLLHQHLRYEISTLLLHEVQEKWKNRPEKDAINAVQVKWVVRASSSGQYHREIAERAEQELNKLGADNAAEVRFCYLSETLLAGATSAQPVQSFEKKPLLGIFCSFYEAVLCNEKVRPSWIEDHLVVLGDTLDKCASGESVPEQTALTPAFIQVLSNVLHKDSSSELSKQLRCLLAATDGRNRLSSLVPLKRREDVFHEVLMVICNHADSETHIEVLRQCADNLASWIEVSTEEENVMRGQALLTSGNRLVFRLMVVSNLLEYCSELGKYKEPYNSDTYFSDSETLKNIVTRRGGPTALPTVERRMDETRSNSIPLCTYAATEKASKARFSVTVELTVDSGTATPVSFEINLDTSVDSSELVELLDRIRAGIESRVEVIERIVRASLHARDSRWSLDERRENVRRSLADPQRLHVVYDQAIIVITSYSIAKIQRNIAIFRNFRKTTKFREKPNCILEPRRPPEPPTDRNKARDICQVLPFANRFRARWFRWSSHSSCRDDKVAVAGPSDILTLRMSKDGEIIDRMVIKLTELTTTHSNPIVKVLWAPNRPALLAVATVQLVRIYDLALDADNFVLRSNVEDIELIHSYEADEMWLMVLSTSGHLSVHYSSVSELLFLSLEKGTWFAPLEKGDLGREDLALKLDKTGNDDSCPLLAGIKWCNGMLFISYRIIAGVHLPYAGADSHSGRVQLKRSAFTHALFTGSSADTIYSMPLFYDSPTNLVYSARWSTLPDLWIENMPSEMCAQAEKEKEEPEAELQDSDLVTLFERCEPVDRVEVSCPDLAIFYDVHDLNVRLSSVGSMPVTAIQKEQFALTMRVGDPNIIVRAVRVELPAERGRGPSEGFLLAIRRIL
ncbi:hypothetical protein OSTOST_22457 [Ostertagia ostertagi]